MIEFSEHAAHQGSSTGRNARRGLTHALLTAAVLSAFVVIRSIMRGSFQWPEHGMTTWSIIGSYFLAAVLVGPLLGSLLWLTSWRLGTFFLGALGGTLVLSIFSVTTGVFRDIPWWSMAIPGLAFGGVALVLQDQQRGATRSSRTFITIVVATGVVLAAIMHYLGWW
jgi:hypothetical protein